MQRAFHAQPGASVVVLEEVHDDRPESPLAGKAPGLAAGGAPALPLMRRALPPSPGESAILQVGMCARGWRPAQSGHRYRLAHGLSVAKPV